MLNSTRLKIDIENALEKSFKEAFKETFNRVKDAGQKNKIVTNEQLSQVFAEEAKKCAGDIAKAIESYIKSAQIMIPSGTSFVPAPSLISPVGPCSGTITFTAPLFIQNCIQ